MWTPVRKQAFWAAVSRAVKTPTIINTSMNRVLWVAPGGQGLIVSTLVGNPNYQSEDLLSYEAGYRLQAKHFSLDATGFVNNYNDGETNENLPPQFQPQAQPPYTVMARQWANNLFGKTFGAEVAVTWNVVSRWKLSGSYSWLKMEMRQNARSNDFTTGPAFNGEAPTNQFGLRSSLQVIRNLQLNTWSAYVGSLPANGVASYIRLDSNFQWRVGERCRLDFGGQNLLTLHHTEYVVGNGAIPTDARRTFFTRFTFTR
jgi:iron complex outermembrane receptor protein